MSQHHQKIHPHGLAHLSDNKVTPKVHKTHPAGLPKLTDAINPDGTVALATIKAGMAAWRTHIVTDYHFPLLEELGVNDNIDVLVVVRTRGAGPLPPDAEMGAWLAELDKGTYRIIRVAEWAISVDTDIGIIVREKVAA